MLVLKRRAAEHKHTIMIGRTHGIHGRADDLRAEVCAVDG